MAGKELPSRRHAAAPAKGQASRAEDPSPNESAELLRRYAGGNEAAAEQIFRRYLGRLVRLARSRLSAKLRARLDADDVVMSAYRSFFIRARQGQFTWQRGGDLWRLLAEITLHKLYRQAARHRAERRSVDAEVAIGDSDASAWHAVDRDPTPEAAVAFTDELEQIMSQLPPPARRVLELRLQGEELADIARTIGRSERTTRRLLALVKGVLRSRMGEATSPRRRAAKTTSNSKKPRRQSGARRSRSQVGRPFQADSDGPEGPSYSLRGTDSAMSDAGRRARPRRRAGKGVTLDPGASLAFHDYVLHQLIGAGATGKVYRATHRPTGRQVAVKYLKKSYIRVPSVVARFVREAGTLEQLRHPGIVAVHGLGRTPNGGFFIVMDLLDGGDLNQRLSAGPVAVEDAIRWLREAAEAIEFAHQHGIIHCDLKPSNLLLDSAGRVYVTDFGLARGLNDRNDAGVLAGTPAFMAPEQVDGTWGEIGPRTDVYGLGAVLCTLLIGRPPYPGPRADAVLARVVSKTAVRFPVEARNRVPQNVVAICLRCLAKRPADRFSSAAELATLLSGTRSAESQVATNGSRPASPQPPAGLPHPVPVATTLK